MAEQQQSVEADEQLVALARKLAEARGHAKGWGEIADQLKEEFAEHAHELAQDQGLDEPRAIVAGGVKVGSISTSTRRIFDKDAFKRAHPEIDLDDYVKISSSTTVRVGDV